jgi:hypothetical protein
MLACSLGMADYGETHHLSPTLPLFDCSTSGASA